MIRAAHDYVQEMNRTRSREMLRNARARAALWIIAVLILCLATCALSGCTWTQADASPRARYASMLNAATTSRDIVTITHTAGEISDDDFYSYGVLDVAFRAFVDAARLRLIDGDDAGADRLLDQAAYRLTRMEALEGVHTDGN